MKKDIKEILWIYFEPKEIKNNRSMQKYWVLGLFLLSGTVLNPLKQVQAQSEEQKLMQLRYMMKSQYREMDSYLDVLFLSLLAEQHVLAFGGPGGSKTETASRVLKAMSGKTFNLQFSPSTKEEQIKGTLIGKEFLEKGVAHYNRDQSLLMHDYAILDEIDKAGPEVLAAALSVLNERKVMAGSEEVLGKLKSALITSNMTLHEFLEKFRNTNDEPTGKALLDRIGFKVLVLNHLSSSDEMHQLLSCQRKKKEQKSVGSREVSCPTLQEELAKIDLKHLQDKIAQVEVPEEVAQLAILLWKRVRKVLQKEQLEEQRICYKHSREAYTPYTMTNQFSTRALTHLIPTMQIAKYMDDLKFAYENSEVKSTMRPLSPMGPFGPLRPEDIWLAHYGMIMQGPGSYERDKHDEHAESGEGGTENSGMKKNPGKEMLKKLKDEFEFEPRTLKMITDLEKERSAFAREYEALLKGYQDELSSLSLAKFGFLARELGDFFSKDLATLSLDQKTRLLAGIDVIRNEIVKRRNEEKKLNDGDVNEGPEEVARIKVLFEIEAWEKSLHTSTPSQHGMAEKLAEMKTQRARELENEKEEQRKKELRDHEEEQERKRVLAEEKKKNQFPAGVKASFQSGGLLWSQMLPDAYAWDNAVNKPTCPPPSRLPTKKEYEELGQTMGVGTPGGYKSDYFVHHPEFLMSPGDDDGNHANFAWTFSWSSEAIGDDYAGFFDGTDGRVSVGNRKYRKDVRCVLQL